MAVEINTRKYRFDDGFIFDVSKGEYLNSKDIENLEKLHGKLVSVSFKGQRVLVDSKSGGENGF